MRTDITPARTVRHNIVGRPSRWPFRATPASPAGAEAIRAPMRHEVEFDDGQRIWLHQVDREGVPHRFLRTLGAPATGALVDLRLVINDTALGLDAATELPGLCPRDVAWYVQKSLRLRFRSLNAFLEEVVRLGRQA